MFFSKLPIGEVFNLCDFIAVKPQMVISKNVCAQSYFDMTLYSFGAGESITWQVIPGDVLLLVLEGEVFLEVKQSGIAKGASAIAGKCLFVKGGNEFQISGNKPYKMAFMVVNKFGGKDMFIKNFEQGKVVTLKDQIDVESGTIASKTLVNSEAMTMTIFAFDAGQGVSTHSASGDAFVCCLEGKAEIELSGEKLTINAGEALIMPANAPHAVKAIEPYKMLLTVVKK
ncbi:cupin domain-containing protein [Treponema sp. Marseille-Q3903]|uniref:cupin domain-containing protein n=1 Tax=Treponema sp. Marseille-Q3903 TaxID=2766703 RepID=UPI001CA33D49|nr:cupin domain-containing protein [Treponema sp. Marseille-Q3903]